MDDGKLIYLVQENEEIFNKCSPYYKFPERKKAIWLKIAKELGTTDEQCIRRWSSLRDRYTKECRQMIQPSGSGTSMKSTWSLFEAMQFLKPHITSRPARCSMNPAFDPQPSSPVEITILSSNSSTSISSPLAPLSPVSSPKMSHLSSKSVKKKRKLDVDTVFCDAVESFKKVCGQRELKTPNPSVQAFGDMIVGTICNMNSTYQIRAMREATDLVMGLKLEHDSIEFLPNF